MQWTQLPLGALEQAVKQAKGSGGADGWDGDEIRFLPKCAVKCFHEITLRWTSNALLQAAHELILCLMAHQMRAYMVLSSM